MYSNYFEVDFEVDEVEIEEGKWFAAWGTHHVRADLEFDPEAGCGIIRDSASRLTVDGMVEFGEDDSERTLTPEEIKVWMREHGKILLEHVLELEQDEAEAAAEAAAEARYGVH